MMTASATLRWRGGHRFGGSSLFLPLPDLLLFVNRRLIFAGAGAAAGDGGACADCPSQLPTASSGG